MERGSCHCEGLGEKNGKKKRGRKDASGLVKLEGGMERGSRPG